MIDVVISFLSSFTQINYVPHLFVALAVLGLVNIVKRVITLNF